MLVPKPPWSCTLLDSVGGRGTLCCQKREDGLQRRFHGLAVVSTTNQTRNLGQLSSWSREAELQRAYYDWPQDDYTVRVVDYAVVSVESPIDIDLCRSHHAQGVVFPVRVSRDAALFYPYWVEDAVANDAGLRCQRADITASELLAKHGCSLKFRVSRNHVLALLCIWEVVCILLFSIGI